LRDNRTQIEKDYLGAPADDFSTRAVWSGEGVDLILEVKTAEEIIDQTVSEAVIELDRCAALVRRSH
jgi:hypothetical protein